jgi:hypothetical protein
MRADALLTLAENMDDLEVAQRAGIDIQAAKEFLPDNPYVLSVSVFVHLDLVNFYRLTNQPNNEQAALRLATADANALERWPTLPYPAYALWYYFGLMGREGEQFEYSRRAAEGPSASILKTRYAIALSRRRQFAEALRVLDERSWDEVHGDELRSYVLAELHPNNINIARSSNEQTKQRYLPEMVREAMESEMQHYRRTLCVLGQTDEAVASYRLARGRLDPETQDWEKRLFDFGSRSISEAELLDVAKEKWTSFYVYYEIGLFRLSEGDRAGAGDSFQKAAQQVFFPTIERDLVQTYLIRMDQDPNWPPWIPVND